MFKQYHLRDYNFRLIIYVVILSIIGILVIGSANDSNQNKQIIGLILGLAVMAFVSVIDYSFILKFSWPLYGLNIILLGLVLVFGDETNGSTRWVDIAGIRFQPSELAKIIIIVFFAYFFSKYEEHINDIKVIIGSFLLAGIPLLMIKKQIS